jgi:predicted HTH transcriptional regulator
MKANELRALIRQPESDSLEFKYRLADSQTAARVLSAFANTNGGRLVIGVEEGGVIRGVDDPARTQRLLEQAATSVSPPISIESEVLSLDGKPIVIATIPQGRQATYYAGSRAFRRVGHVVVPLTAPQTYDLITHRVTSIDDVLAEVRRQTVVIDDLNQKVDAATNWRNKIPELLLGGVIGALISQLFSALVGTK